MQRERAVKKVVLLIVRVFDLKKSLYFGNRLAGGMEGGIYSAF